METTYWKELVDLRKEIHRFPELSGDEYKTKERVREYCQKQGPSQILSLGNTGLAVIFEGDEEGETTLFRAELDALPIKEVNSFDYASENEGVSHKCGHDGHMVNLCALAKKLGEEPPKKGRVVLLFQPAEENGKGAQECLADEKFGQIAPDRVFAYHNLPGYKKSKLVYRKGTFTAAAKSLIIKLKGKTSHAAEPELGINPSLAISKILGLQHEYADSDIKSDSFFLITPVYVNMGEKAYGVSAGYGEVHLTLRSFSNTVMDAKVQLLQAEIDRIAQVQELKLDYDWTEVFDANENNDDLVDEIVAVAKKTNVEVEERPTPFKWGEDFGLFTRKYPGVMFGIGSGENCPALHNPDYDFPDEIMETGLNVFNGLVSRYHR